MNILVFELMSLILKVLIAGLLPLFTLFAQDGVHTSTVSLGVGGETPTYNIFGESSGPTFAGNYEYRILKYFAVEGGFQSMLPLQSAPIFGISSGAGLVITPCANGCLLTIQSSRTMVNLVPLGAKFVLPLVSDRAEIFAGAGAAYAFHSDGSYHNAVLAQGSLGGRIAMDRGHRFWLGTSGHFFGNGGRNQQEWLSWSADFGIRF